jgi:hypothetical protein
MVLNSFKIEKLRNQCWNFSKKTFLHHWHTAHRANIAPFGGYDMPLVYASAKNEHLKVKKKLETGQTLFLQDDRRTIRVRVAKDIRPDRTARLPINELIS